ncbi:GNAT family N-acetyltransferase [Urechidicola croceus]|uniref:N-acetyltransferase domain-containing protein n=1 Tax=Urechidicola croceus TaxID=1850246 RepID=A0A1D8P7F1_9FLAO|nr:GNAT family N-acetyltransferase [Urechidicola croceus]AOW20481.1 hypothetical protein LPB138_07250 [Urechidicola croceus]
MLLETERLIISKMTVEYAPFILELLNDPDYIRFIGDKKVKTLKEAEKHIIEKYLENYNNQKIGFYLVSLKKDKTPIGTSGLVDREGLDCHDIGFAYLPKFRGKGYAYEAAKKILDYATNELKLNPIAAITTKDNIKSANLLERLGLKFEKLILIPNDSEELRLFKTQ